MKLQSGFTGGFSDRRIREVFSQIHRVMITGHQKKHVESHPTFRYHTPFHVFLILFDETLSAHFAYIHASIPSIFGSTTLACQPSLRFGTRVPMFHGLRHANGFSAKKDASVQECSVGNCHIASYCHAAIWQCVKTLYPW